MSKAQTERREREHTQLASVSELCCLLLDSDETDTRTLEPVKVLIGSTLLSVARSAPSSRQRATTTRQQHIDRIRHRQELVGHSSVHPLIAWLRPIRHPSAPARVSPARA